MVYVYRRAFTREERSALKRSIRSMRRLLEAVSKRIADERTDFLQDAVNQISTQINKWQYAIEAGERAEAYVRDGLHSKGDVNQFVEDLIVARGLDEGYQRELIQAREVIFDYESAAVLLLKLGVTIPIHPEIGVIPELGEEGPSDFPEPEEVVRVAGNLQGVAKTMASQATSGPDDGKDGGSVPTES